MTDNIEPALLTQGQVAKKLGISKKQVRRWEQMGMPGRRTSNPVRYSAEVIDDWIARGCALGQRKRRRR
jgi:DNA-binding transcriptional MerR regulator